jgi:hypothetical protein
MKKYIVGCITCCILSIGAQAQKKWTAGIKGGLNITDVSNMNGDSRYSGHLGLYIRTRMNTQWSFQPELLYSGQGQQFEVLNEDVTLALNYLQIPLMFQYRPVQHVYLELGPQLNFLLSAKVKNDDDKVEVDDDYNKVDLGLGFGAGIRVTNMLGFYGRYNVGLSDITDNDNRDRYNRVFQLGMYIRLN